MAETRGIGNCRRCGHPIKSHGSYGQCEADTLRGSRCRCPQATEPEAITGKLPDFRAFMLFVQVLLGMSTNGRG